MSVCTHVRTDYQGRLNALSGGNVYNVMVHVSNATLRGLKSFILGLI